MTDRSALIAAVAVEHEVIYGYGVAGAHLRGRARTAALDALTAHRLRRDRLSQLLLAQHIAPPAANVGYALPFAVTDDQSAQRLCAQLEQACAGAAWDAVAASSAGSVARSLAVEWLADAATRAASWRAAAGPGPALPGQPG